MHENRAADWFLQAENDWAFAENALGAGFFAQCCFICQQVSEKALKSMLLARGAKAAFTHSLLRLCQALGVNGELAEMSGVLDQYYVTGRYPDALPGSAPFQAFSRRQATEALDFAKRFLELARAEVVK